MSEPITNEKKPMMKTDYGDEKMDKTVELNDSMTIAPSGADEYEKKIKSLKGE